MMRTEPRGLHAGFLAAADARPESPALTVGGSTLTFAALRDRAAALAATADRHSPGGGPPLTAVLAHRSSTAFAGVLAALFRGHGYVPLHPDFPPERTRSMLERAGCTEIVADARSAPLLETLLAGSSRRTVVLLPDSDDAAELGESLHPHRVVGPSSMERPESWEPREPDPSGIAYLLFTSGSTGVPKGVMVMHRNAVHFVETAVDRYDIREDDRFSQTFDLTFDLSVFDMFVAWERGACVCCPSAKALIAPGRYVEEAGLTVWFSVPSLAATMTSLGLLRDGDFPALRWSLFCGEALPASVAEAWSRAAPNSTVENLYGPTEATIACTGYRWDPARSPSECELGVVPIGTPLPGTTSLVADEALVDVGPGESGELLVAGPQVTAGYLDDPERTAASFVRPPGRTAVHYRTGDRVRRPAGDEPLRYLGRLDDQIKVQGHRVELGEVEAAVRDAGGVSDVAAVGWPVTSSGFGGIVAFVAAGAVEAVDLPALRSGVARRLPRYMVPREIRVVGTLPRNANGKRDRKALVRMLDEGR
jgi:amino acid adenylation domain-containing protein